MRGVLNHLNHRSHLSPKFKSFSSYVCASANSAVCWSVLVSNDERRQILCSGAHMILEGFSVLRVNMWLVEQAGLAGTTTKRPQDHDSRFVMEPTHHLLFDLDLTATLYIWLLEVLHEVAHPSGWLGVPRGARQGRRNPLWCLKLIEANSRCNIISCIHIYIYIYVCIHMYILGSVELCLALCNL